VITNFCLRQVAQRVRGLTILVGAIAAAGPMLAWTGAPPPPTVVMGDLSRRDIRVPESEPSFSGTWFTLTSDRTMAPLDGGTTPFQPWSFELFERRGNLERSGVPQFDPNANCVPPGLPRWLQVPFAFEIVQTPDKIFFLSEIMHSFRVIHMDGKPKPADYQRSDYGYSIGRWEGDALVVETTGLNGYTPSDIEGRAKSNQMRVVEQLRKVAPNQLEITFTLYDPVTFTRPWTARTRFAWRPDVRVQEYVCEENNRNRTLPTGTQRGH
jgi:hypothetical protein